MTMTLPSTVRIVEVGPRDGLQNEPKVISSAQKIAFIRDLVQSGLTEIEVSSFVNPRRIPQLADAEAVIAGLMPFKPGTVYSGLVPNERGLDRALPSGLKRIAVFTAASETFTQKNINMTIGESLKTFEPVIARARENGLSVRGYVSTCFVCPYEGDIAPQAVSAVTRALFDSGVDEVSLGDTIGAAAPTDVEKTIGLIVDQLGADALALHFHDTYGTALANVIAGLTLGISTFDSAAGGLGGCPYAPGASGNVATEDLVYLLTRMGIETGVDLNKLAEASHKMQTLLGRTLPSKQLQRLLSSGCMAS